MFGKKENISIELMSDVSTNFANLFIKSYLDKSLSAMHAIVVSLLTTMQLLIKDQNMHIAIIGNFKAILSQSEIQKNDLPLINCLIAQYISPLEEDEFKMLLNWYHTIDEEWMLRKTFKKDNPEFTNSQITQMICNGINSEK